MHQQALWPNADYSARRTALIAMPSTSAFNLMIVDATAWRQREFWPRRADAGFAASRTMLVDVTAMAAYQQFARFLRDQLRLDHYIRRGRYRLEYVAFQHGAPQYRIYCRDIVLAVAETSIGLMQVQRGVAAYAMAAYGFAPGEVYFTRIDPLVRKYPREGHWREIRVG